MFWCIKSIAVAITQCRSTLSSVGQAGRGAKHLSPARDEAQGQFLRWPRPKAEVTALCPYPAAVIMHRYNMI